MDFQIFSPLLFLAVISFFTTFKRPVLALLAVMVGGCSHTPPAVDIQLVEPRPLPERFKKRLPSPDAVCAPLEKADYTVPEMETVRDCYRLQSFSIRDNYHSLQDTQKQREDEWKKLKQEIDRLNGKKKSAPLIS